MYRGVGLRRLAWLLVALLALGGAGASAEHLRLNVIVELRADAVTEFENAWGTVRDALVEADYPHYTVVSESGLLRHFVSVVNTQAGLADALAFEERIRAIEDADLQAAITTLESAVVHHRSYVSRHDQLLSYAPEGSYAGPYHRLRTFSFVPAQRTALAGAFSKLNAAWAAANIPSAFHVMWHTLGANGGEVTMLTSASTPIEHASKERTVRAAVGEAYDAFDAALWTATGGSQTRYWLSRPELTLKPKSL